MSKISHEAARALVAREEYKKSNTQVTQLINEHRFFLFGNLIAYHNGTRLIIQDAGWRSKTTKERLNAILEAFGDRRRIVQRRREWFIADSENNLSPWMGRRAIKIS